MRTALVALLIVLIALLIFNPDMDDFRLFAEEQSERLLLDEAGDTAFGRALSSLGGSLAGSYVDRITEYNNYLFFSIYTIDLDGADAEGEEWKFLGIAGMFFEREAPESVQERREER